MANFRGHIVGGLLAGAALASVVSILPAEQLVESAGLIREWQFLTGLLVISMLFGLFPDVDTNSKAQDVFFGIVFLLDVLLIWRGYIEAAAFLGLIAMLPIVGHHRGWTHKKWAIFVVPLPILLIPYLSSQQILATNTIYYIAAVAGYFSHLLLDGLMWKKFRIKN